MRKAIFIFLFSFSLLAAQEVRVTATADSSFLTIGDWMNVQLEVLSRSNAAVFFPALKDTLGDFEIVKQDSVVREETSEGITYKKRITVTSFQEGLKYLPPIAVAYRHDSDTAVSYAQSNPIAVEIRMIEVDTSQSIKDIKPVMDLPMSWEEIALYSGIALLIAFLGYMLYRRLTRPNTGLDVMDEEKPKIPPHILALLKLDDLDAQKLWQSGEVKQFYSQSSEIIREYFERRYNILALEMTTGEVMEQLERCAVSKEVLQSIENLLSQADLVKFAKYNPTGTENESVIPDCRTIINSTKPSDSTEHSAQQTGEANG